MPLLHKILKRIRVAFLYFLGKIRGLFSQCKYHIKKGYLHREKYLYWDDTTLKDEYQKEVYELASLYKDKYASTTIVDIGCGSAYKLMRYFNDCDTIGIEVSPTYEYLLRAYPGRKWINAAQKDNYPSAAGIIICSDVIEHLTDPDELIASINKISFDFLFISTPERDMIRGWYNYGPPDNRHHIREWNAKEFRSYLSPHFEIISHQITNIEDATQLLICRKKGAPGQASKDDSIP